MAAPSSAGFRLNVWLLAFNLQNCLDALGPCSTHFSRLRDYTFCMSQNVSECLRHWNASIEYSVNWRLLITLSSGAVAKPSEPWQCRPNGRKSPDLRQRFRSISMSTDVNRLDMLGWHGVAVSPVFTEWFNMLLILTESEDWNMNERSMKNQTLSLLSLSLYEPGFHRLPGERLDAARLLNTEKQGKALWLRWVCRSLWDLEVR